MYPSNSIQSHPGSRLQKSADSVDPFCLDRCTLFTRVSICQFLLIFLQRKEFLEDLITGDRSWVLYNSKAHRAVWLLRGEDPPTQAKSDLHSKKCLLYFFWVS
ncbi:hypothetical protein Y032_0495g2465 [Ancylostoma ceylanicum]|uniref:Uncharacterized protein n=1 Tax=Ancylostoma ceylanicum TaxID=53326 RepID=A0A016WWG9_9BILA|nr:hypothetical protein Y032_0495g2465 [Ancylostoma ceylanicum]